MGRASRCAGRRARCNCPPMPSRSPGGSRSALADIPLFGTTTGKPLDLRRDAGAHPPGGGVRWRTTGEIEAVLEFTTAGRWSAYQVKGDDGSTVIYEAA